MVIFKTMSKGEDGKRSTMYHVSADGKIALCSFARLADAALVLRFMDGGNLSDELAERALEVLRQYDSESEGGI